MTQITQAQKGIITNQIKQVADFEGLTPEKILKRVAEGTIVIPHNPIHSPDSIGIGKGLRVKVNANIGTSREHCDVEEEIEKARVAENAKAHAIMDLSTGGDLTKIRTELLKVISVPFGTVPIYQAGIEAISKHGSIIDMTEDDMFNAFEQQAKQGVSNP